MSVVYSCGSERRRVAVRDSAPRGDGTWLNGVEFLEVFEPSPTEEAWVPRHRVLVVHLLKDLPAGEVAVSWFTIEGGVRVPSVEVIAAARVADLLAGSVEGFSDEARLILSGEADAPDPMAPDEGDNRLDERDRVLILICAEAGDFARYTLTIAPPGGSTTQTWDPRLSAVEFQFRIDCPNPFDCEEPPCPPEEAATAPPLDYLSRDYASFRRLLLDRLSQTLPNWSERSPADLGVTLVEVFAYAGDHLSYFQDAVATEAYLGTARRRVSLRRHARLLDYTVSEGVNARAWVCLEVSGGDLVGTEDAPAISTGDRVITRVAADRAVYSEDEFQRLVDVKRPTVFEALHDLVAITEARSRIAVYTWEDDACCLPKGATEATLTGSAGSLGLATGDVLVFVEVRHPETGAAADARPAWRHAVRLVEVDATETDPLTGVEVVNVRWGRDDALPFPFCLTELTDPADGTVAAATVVLGNVLLVDHGRTIADEALDPAEVPTSGRYRPRLPRAGVTWAAPYDHNDAREGSATEARSTDVRDAVPAVALDADGLEWLPVQDLFSSGPSAREFVVEVDVGDRAILRFGDGVNGRRPAAGTEFALSYRVGGGASGNVGSDRLVHVVGDTLKALADGSPGVTLTVTNPLPGAGGVDAEPARRIRQDAPRAYRVQERAVTAEDYTTVLLRHPRVQQAVATPRWTGSWNTWFIAVDPLGADGLDEELRDELYQWLERFRLAGRDLRIDGPRYVPLELSLRVCVASGHLRSAVRARLLDHFSSRVRADGTLGWFHPDRWTFGQSLYVSQVVSEAMSVTGVHNVEPVVVRRWDREAEAVDGVLTLDRLEVPRLDNDPNQQENGLLELEMEGGR